jgi:hypothetical protein
MEQLEQGLSADKTKEKISPHFIYEDSELGEHACMFNRRRLCMQIKWDIFS